MAQSVCQHIFALSEFLFNAGRCAGALTWSLDHTHMVGSTVPAQLADGDVSNCSYGVLRSREVETVNFRDFCIVTTLNHITFP